MKVTSRIFMEALVALKTWSKPTLPKPTVEDSNDADLGWTAQYTAGPTHTQAYAPWVTGHAFVFATDIVDPTTDPTAVTATTTGTLAAATYTYAYSWVGRNGGETLPSNTVDQVTTGSTSKNTITVPAKPAWADFTQVYRQVSGTLRRLGTTLTTTYVDDGSVDPTGKHAPLATSTAQTAANH